MKILITGGAGFIGSHLADRLITGGHEVRGIDNFSTGRQENWPGCEGGDIGQKYALDRFEPHDLIIHCAASYDDRLKWHRDTSTNVNGAINVAIAAREWDARVVYFQTALIYGNNPYTNGMTRWWTDSQGVEHDRQELSSWPLPIEQETKPENSYAISKYAGGQYLRHADIPLLEFRLANIYGPRNLSGPVPTFYKRISEGERCMVSGTRRDFVYIDDLVDLVTQAIDQESTGTYHVSTGRDYPIAQAYDAVVGAMDAYAHPEPEFVQPGADDAPTIILDPVETQRDFSWVATTDLDEGVEKAVEWYREHGVEQTFTHLAQKG
jgi:UDP-glucose 4-epimerase